MAFYLQFPPGSSNAVIKKDVLASIVKGSLTKISSAINANITSVEVLIADTTTSATTVHATYPTDKEESKTMYYIIGGCVAGGVVLIIIVIVAIWCCKNKNGYVVIMQAFHNQKTIESIALSKREMLGDKTLSNAIWRPNKNLPFVHFV